MDITPEARERLARYMEGRALDLRLSWREVAGRAGVSIETLRLLRAGGDGVRPATLRGIDAALEWRPGSARTILAGGEPEPSAVAAGEVIAGEVIAGDDDLVEEAVRAAVEGYRAKVRARMAEIAAEREADGRTA